MAPAKRSGKGKTTISSPKTGEPPTPFKPPPEVLNSFIRSGGLSKKHVYITHIDTKPADLKRKVFLVPIAMNVCVALAFVWRMYTILPWYFNLFIVSGLGYRNETTFPTDQAPWSALSWEVGRRFLTLAIDFALFVFVWPWPVEFVAGRAHGNPTQWRWKVGFRPKEIYVRRSRDWDQVIKDIFRDPDSMTILTAYIQQATAPMLQEQKTGYLLMNGQWDLDWKAMVSAHALVDSHEIALEAFRNVVLVHHRDHGWLCYDMQTKVAASEEERRRQVFLFRDALTEMGKEDLFYRWVEIVQFEATQPGGFGPEKQEAAAKRIRELFEAQNVDFDDLWKKTMGAATPNAM